MRTVSVKHNVTSGSSEYVRGKYSRTCPVFGIESCIKQYVNQDFTNATQFQQMTLGNFTTFVLMEVDSFIMAVLDQCFRLCNGIY